MKSRRVLVSLRLVLGGLCILVPIWYSISISKNPVWLVLAITALGAAFGILLFKARLPSCAISVGMLFLLGVFLILASRGRPFGTTCANWLGGYLSVAAIVKKSQSVANTKSLKDESVWRVGGDEIQNASLAERTARGRMATLDGEKRYIVSVTNAFARFDVVGSAVDGLVVYCSTDARLDDRWSLLLSPSTDRSAVDVRMGPNMAHLPHDNVVALELAYSALEDFTVHRTPSTRFIWFTGTEASNRRPPFLA